MAALVASLVQLCRIPLSCQPCKMLNPLNMKLLRSAKTLSFTTLVYCGSKETEALKKLQIPEAKTLSHEYLIKQACNLTIDSTSQLLLQTMNAIIDIGDKYRSAMQSLIVLMEELQTLSNFTEEENQMWDQIVETRSYMEDSKRALLELSSFLEYVRKMATAAAETSFLAGSEFSSTSMCERINSMEAMLSEENKKNKKTESEYLETEKQFISKASKKRKKSK